MCSCLGVYACTCVCVCASKYLVFAGVCVNVYECACLNTVGWEVVCVYACGFVGPLPRGCYCQRLDEAIGKTCTSRS